MDNFYQQNEGFWEICDKRCLRGFPAKSSRYVKCEWCEIFYKSFMKNGEKRGEDILNKHMGNKKLRTDFDEK